MKSATTVMDRLLLHWVQDVIRRRGEHAKQLSAEEEATDIRSERRSDKAEYRQDVSDLREQNVRYDAKLEARQDTLDAIASADSHQVAADQALNQSVSGYLQGLVTSASGNDASAVSIPSGVRVASAQVSGPPLAQIEALISQAKSEAAEGKLDDASQTAQQSAAWALGNGLMPHPSDVGALYGAAGGDSETQQRLSKLGSRLDALPDDFAAHPGLKVQASNQRLDVMQAYAELLNAFGGDALLDLVTHTQVDVAAQDGLRAQSRTHLDAILDDLWT